MTTKERLHRLIDDLPESAERTVELFIEFVTTRSKEPEASGMPSRWLLAGSPRIRARLT